MGLRPPLTLNLTKLLKDTLAERLLALIPVLNAADLLTTLAADLSDLLLLSSLLLEGWAALPVENEWGPLHLVAARSDGVLDVVRTATNDTVSPYLPKLVAKPHHIYHLVNSAHSEFLKVVVKKLYYWRNSRITLPPRFY